MGNIIHLTIGNDNLSGDVGNDTFKGPVGGTDTLLGQGGDDRLILGAGAAGAFDGGTGIDLVRAIGGNLGSVTFVNVEELNFSLDTISATPQQLASFGTIETSSGASDVNIFLTGGFGGSVNFGTRWHGNSILHIDGSGSGNVIGNSITGTDRGDFIIGSDFHDALVGGGGNDDLNSRGGTNDLLIGGDGNDRLEALGPGAILDGGNGKDTMIAHFSASIDCGAGRDEINTEAALGGDVFFISGGGGSDIVKCGPGTETLVIDNVSDSTGLTRDIVSSIDLRQDKIDVPTAVTGVDGPVNTGLLRNASFDIDLATFVGAGQLAAGHALLFTPNGGDNAGHIFLVVDQNGIAGYQAGADVVIEFKNPTDLSLDIGDFQ